jgi:hypothetical protein
MMYLVMTRTFKHVNPIPIQPPRQDSASRFSNYAIFCVIPLSQTSPKKWHMTVGRPSQSVMEDVVDVSQDRIDEGTKCPKGAPRQFFSRSH